MANPGFGPSRNGALRSHAREGELFVVRGVRVAPDRLWSAYDNLLTAQHLLSQAAVKAVHASTASWAYDLAHHAAVCGQLASKLDQAIRGYTNAEAQALWLASAIRSFTQFEADAVSVILQTVFGVPQPVAQAAGASLGLMLDLQSLVLPLLLDRRFANTLLAQQIEHSDALLLGPSGATKVRNEDRPTALLQRFGTGPNPARLTERMTVTAGRPVTVPPPRSLAECAERMPQGAEQVRIERYGTEAHPAYIVYVKGTDFMGDAHEPMNLASNLPAVAGQVAASQVAVEQAMRRQGIRAGDPVILVGHSQGALVAERLADSGRSNVKQVVTFGGPLGTEHPRVRTLAIEHFDDPVPSLAGVQEPSDNVLRVRAKAPGISAANPNPFAAHDMSTYVKTAALVDTATDQQVASSVAAVRAFATGSGTATLWQARLR